MALPPPTASGVRVAGDHYQWLVAWTYCLRMRRDQQREVANPIVEVELEAADGANLDDVVVRREHPPHTYLQVKYAVDARAPVNEDYLLTPTRSGGRSILQKLLAGWRELSAEDTSVDLALVTNRSPDPGDPLVAARDSRTQLLMERAARGGPSSEKGKGRTRWAAHLGVEPDELGGLLRVLRFDLARDVSALRDEASLLAQVTGLRADPEDIEAGAAWVGRQVRDSRTRINAHALAGAVEELGLEAPAPVRAAVSIATLAPDPLAGECELALDWVSRFEGSDAFAKRRPAPPATWADLQGDIEALLPGALPPEVRSVALRGSMRQATGFLVGAALRDVTGHGEISLLQRGQQWSTATDYREPVAPATSTRTLGEGPELGVVVAVATAGPALADVESYLRREHSEVGELLVCEPTAGARDTALSDAASAVALAVGIRDAVRRAARTHPHVHLFLIGPLGLAVLLGHRWNAIAPTVIYEDVRGPVGYAPAFHISA